MLSYVFPLYPNREQREELELTLETCRIAYNSLLEELHKQQIPDRSAMQHKLVEMKKSNPGFGKVYSKTLQYECYRLFSNLSALRSLKKKGRKTGRLRFKGKEWFKTIVYNQSGFRLEKVTEKRSIIHLSRIGSISIKTHRAVEGSVKGLIIKRSCGRWYLILQTDARRKDIVHGSKEIGIDVGIESYLTDSNGIKVQNPKTLEKYRMDLASAQKELSRKRKGSANRAKAKRRMERLHRRVTNARNDFLHKTSARLVRGCRFIAVERLDIKGMMERPNYNARNIADASWNRFLQMLRYKAESAGCGVVEVDPANTTRMCSSCASLQEMPLYKRVYDCGACSMSMDRDCNSAINILKKAYAGPERAYAENMDTYSMKQEASGF
jgi:putative transposase